MEQNVNKVAVTMLTKKYHVISGLDIVILGEDDFLKDYILTVDYPNKQFSIKLP